MINATQRIRWWIILAVMWLGGGLWLEGQPGGFRVTPCGVRVAAPVAEEVRLFQGTPGTTVALWVSGDGRTMLGVEHDESKVGRWVDDRGGDLSSGASFGFFPQFSPDKKAAAVEVSSPVLPGSGAVAMDLEGEIWVTVGGPVKVHRTGKLKMEVGVTFSAGGVEFKVEHVGEPKNSWLDKPFEVSLGAEQRLNHLVEVRFLGGDGKAVETSDGGSSTMSFGDQVQTKRSFVMDAELKEAELELLMHEGMERVRIPFKVRAGLGVEKPER